MVVDVSNYFVEGFDIFTSVFHFKLISFCYDDKLKAGFDGYYQF